MEWPRNFDQVHVKGIVFKILTNVWIFYFSLFSVDNTFTCIHCSEKLTFRSAADLLPHCVSCPRVDRPTVKHTNVCILCSYFTNQKAHMKRHLRKHTGEKPYKCYYCSYQSSDSSVLRKHEKLHAQLSDNLRRRSLSI